MYEKYKDQNKRYEYDYSLLKLKKELEIGYIGLCVGN